ADLALRRVRVLLDRILAEGWHVVNRRDELSAHLPRIGRQHVIPMNDDVLEALRLPLRRDVFGNLLRARRCGGMWFLSEVAMPTLDRPRTELLLEGVFEGSFGGGAGRREAVDRRNARAVLRGWPGGGCQQQTEERRESDRPCVHPWSLRAASVIRTRRKIKTSRRAAPARLLPAARG